MNRQEFLKTTLIGLAGFSLTSSFAASTFGNPVMPGNWAWLDGSVNTPSDEWKLLFDKMLHANITGLLVNGSNELYEKIGPLSQKYGIQIHAWRWTLNRGDYMKDHPEWYTVNRLGHSVVDKPPYVNYYRWLCPSRPEVTDILAKDYSGISQIPGIAGVHLDYVRYSDIYLPVGLLPKYNLVQDHEMPEFDYCYCSLCRSTFREKSGYDPMDLEDPAADKAWHQFRLDQVVKVVHSIAGAVHKQGSVITAAVFPTPEMSRTMVRQDWARFNLDAYHPMLYHQYYNQPADWIGECVKEIRQEIGNKTPVYPGIMVNPREFTPEVLARTLRQIKDAGAQGIAAFTAGGLTDQQLKVLASNR